MHMHQEEHRVLSRNGRPILPGDPDYCKEDVIALAEGEEVTIYRNFESFTGKYVVHCHNLIHEDHAMMFAWTIMPPDHIDVDFNGDGVVDLKDFAQLAADWKKRGDLPTDVTGPFNVRDSNVDLYDLAAFVEEWLHDSEDDD
jgi:hypothetical protein